MRSGGRKAPGRYRRRGWAPPRLPRRRQPRSHGLGGRLRFLPALGTALGVAALLKLVYEPWFLNYDARYALVWARDLATGLTPDYEGPFAPTPHPLETVVSLSPYRSEPAATR